MRVGLTVAAIGALTALEGQAAAIRVPEDAPDVLKGVDLPQPGDSVIVGPGVWTERATRTIPFAGGLTSVTANAFLKGGIALISSAGAYATSLQATETGPGEVSPVLVFANQAGTSVVIEGFTVVGVWSGLSASGVSANPPSVTVRGCRFLSSGQGMWVVNENLDPKYWPPAPLDLFVDPQFCDPLALDFTFQSSSPCVNHPTCGQIGRFGVGCGPTSVRADSWARIKSVYRGEAKR